MPSVTMRKRTKRSYLGRDNSPDLEDQLPAVSDMQLEATKEVEEEGSETEMEKQETAGEKRLRLARQYLEKIKQDIDSDEEDVDGLVAERLETDVLEKAGKMFYHIAAQHTGIESDRILRKGRNCHQLSVTCISVVCREDDVYIYSVSKDSSIVKWDLNTGEKLEYIPGGLNPTKRLRNRDRKACLTEHVGHTNEIFTCAASADGKLLATGGRDKIIHIWSIGKGSEPTKHLGQFKQHRDSITSLTFSKVLPASSGSNPVGSATREYSPDFNRLYSSSMDRSVKVWNADELAYVETLFGHQDSITCIRTLTRERALTCGSRDRTMRLWKIAEESQLVYRSGSGGNVEDDLLIMMMRDANEDQDGHGGNMKKRKRATENAGGSLDVVCMVDEDTFISGSDSGAISIWNAGKKKPMYTRLRCHGTGTTSSSGSSWDGKQGDNCNWIISLAAVPYSDLFCSGSCDGTLRFWKIAEDKRSFSPLFSFEMTGFINELEFLKSGEDLHVVAAVGQEHRLGRWWRSKPARNSVHVLKVQREV